MTDKEKAMKDNRRSYGKAVCLLVGAMVMVTLSGCGKDSKKEERYDYYAGDMFAYDDTYYVPKDMWIKLYRGDKAEIYIMDDVNTGTYEEDDEKLTLYFDGGETRIKGKLIDDTISFEYEDADWVFVEADEDDRDVDSDKDDEDDDKDSDKKSKKKSSDGEVLDKLYNLHEATSSFDIDPGIDVEDLYKDFMDE